MVGLPPSSSLQALRAKAITEGRVHGPKAKQRQFELQQGEVECEPYDFPDGELKEASNYLLSLS